MNEQSYNLVIAVLGALLVASQVFNMLFARKAVDGQKDAFPSSTPQLVRILLQGGMNLAKLTPSTADDEALKLVATSYGYTVTQGANGDYLVTKATPPPPITGSLASQAAAQMPEGNG